MTPIALAKRMNLALTNPAEAGNMVVDVSQTLFTVSIANLTFWLYYPMLGG